MKSWLTWCAFGIAAFMTALARLQPTIESNYGSAALIEAAITIIFGGLFWGIVGLFIYNRFSKKP